MLRSSATHAYALTVCADPLCTTQTMDTTDPDKLGPQPVEVGGVQLLRLLDDCSGAFRPGILTALIGSSGAGKTTLMDVLACRKTSESTF